MEYLTFSDDNENLKYAVIVKSTSANRKSLIYHYLDPLKQLGINHDEIVVISITVEGKKIKAADAKEELKKVAKGLDSLGINKVLVANGDLFKFITGVSKTSDCFGEPFKGKLEGFEEKESILSIDYSALVYNESLRFKLNNSLEVFTGLCKKSFNLKKDIIHSMVVPETADEIGDVLEYISQYDALTCDIETESLRFEHARIVTISFALDEHNGCVFSIDTEEESEILGLLYDFFCDYEGTLIFHGGLYDIKVIIYQIFMEDSLDVEGLIHGLKTFDNSEDSMLVTYLATNSTQEVPLGLKENSFEFAGNYGIEFDDEHSVHDYPREEVLEYNLKDALATWYVYKKHYPTILADDQVDIYRNLFLPSMLPLLYMMLIGMPMDMDKVYAAEEELEKEMQRLSTLLSYHVGVKETVQRLREKRYIKDFADRYDKAKVNTKTGKKDRIKIKTLSDIPEEPFNPNSDQQKAELLYSVLDLPVLGTTDTGAPSCDANTLKMVVNHTDDLDAKDIINKLQEYAAASIVLSTFIRNFIKFAFQREDGSWWLNGNLKLGGTQSGRLASNSPNMQNLPSNSKYGKLVKACFIAPEGWLFGGADFSSLEHRVGSILTGDPEMISEYVRGLDGHCNRSYRYFQDEMPLIEQATDEQQKYYEITLHNGMTYFLTEKELQALPE